ncbi:DNA topoisomerase IB [Rhizorhapis sp. SPR117]|uniref:DNA topoisomerase IB n=1 Tax=Rhizorhapis sp. SPR117 TaxID=2912611 RepID=UPI001F23733D|nr:DNA topoisomerase IB [Rhizorhapis sp. SPR117]
MPGISRRKCGRGWTWWNSQGQRITDPKEIERLKHIGLPPAYERAWFCPDPRGHIQATGFDEKGRKQYRYHPDFRAQQEAGKFANCISFAQNLPRIRRRVERDLTRPGLDRTKVVAAVVRLLDESAIRVGNEDYARKNRSFGATTLRTRHARLNGTELRLRFVAKSGRKQTIAVEDPLLTRVVRRCQDLPEQHLFAYADEAGEIHAVSSSDVNDYIRQSMGQNFTAKHFRTWAASVIAYEQLLAAGANGLPLRKMLEPVAQSLGNTPAIARKSYIHPALIDLAKNRKRVERRGQRKTKYYSAAERELIVFLEKANEA